jgi:catechol 2,3-dioxygenase-like lactoylglutathione lyase family enzyme
VPIHHLQLWVPDLARAEESWGWLLGELGFEFERRWRRGIRWREDGTSVVIEQSPDMVPGMLHSRLRPGMNHVAFHVPTTQAVARLLTESTDHGWRLLADAHFHPLPDAVVAGYLEDRDGFEVELIAPGPIDPPAPAPNPA